MEYISHRDSTGMPAYGFPPSVTTSHRRIPKDHTSLLMEYWPIRRASGLIHLNGKRPCNEKDVEHECTFIYISLLLVGTRTCTSIIRNSTRFQTYLWNFEIIGWFVHIPRETKVRYFSNRVWRKKNITSGEVSVNTLECFKHNNNISQYSSQQ